ncbi:uncharacterized protein BJX67DRAFT_113017 [Aspergillus lucknowensis]|uniref:Uncharacterized protein n=1 Tax=Aspergillus lucknowensis TaxID=176173 RepID=A0ABR4LR95_9EURO
MALGPALVALVPVLRRAVQAAFSGQGSAHCVRTGQEPKPFPPLQEPAQGFLSSPFLVLALCLITWPFPPFLASPSFSSLLIYLACCACFWRASLQPQQTDCDLSRTRVFSRTIK